MKRQNQNRVISGYMRALDNSYGEFPKDFEVTVAACSCTLEDCPCKTTQRMPETSPECDDCCVDGCKEENEQETERDFFYVVTTPESSSEVDSLEEAMEVITELSEEDICNPLECTVYKVFIDNVYEVRQDLSLVKSLN